MNEIVTKLYCVQVRSGVEIWLDEARAIKLQDALQEITSHKFIRYETQTINTADIVGVFEATSMEELTRRKNGQWKCSTGTWHERKTECMCSYEKEKRLKMAAMKKKFEEVSPNQMELQEAIEKLRKAL